MLHLRKKDLLVSSVADPDCDTMANLKIKYYPDPDISKIIMRIRIQRSLHHNPQSGSARLHYCNSLVTVLEGGLGQRLPAGHVVRVLLGCVKVPSKLSVRNIP